MEVRSVKGGRPARPHLVQDLQRLFEFLEPNRQRWKRNPETARLALVPGSADAEVRAAAGQYVEGGGGLDQDARMAVDDAGHQNAQTDALCHRSQKAEGGIGLQHRAVDGSDPVDLEEVIHDPQAGETGVLGGSGNVGQAWANRGRAARPIEADDLEAEVYHWTSRTRSPRGRER